MTEEKDKRPSQRADSVKDSRQDRLKVALRENLKRRKAQAKERKKLTGPASRDDEVS